MAEAAAASPAAPRAAVIAGTGAVLGCVLPGFLTASLVVEIGKDFAFGATALGLGLAAAYGSSAVSATIAGRLVDRIGVGRALRSATALSGASALAIALFADSAVALVVLLASNGLGAAMVQPAVAALLTRAVPEQRRGLAFGIQTSGPQLAAVLAGLALPAVAIPLGWRWAFVIAAGIVLVSGVLAPSGAGAVQDAPRVPERPPRHRLTPIRLLALGAMAASTAGIGMRTFLVLFGIQSGLSAASAGVLLAGTGLLAVSSRIGAGVLTDRRRGDPLLVAALLLAGCGAGFLLLAAGGLGLIVAGALLAGGIGWGWQPLFRLAAVQETPNAPGAAVGLQMSGFFAGAVAGPLLVAGLSEAVGYAATWIGCSALISLSLLTALAARGRRGRSR